jgi:hypothetical protein
MLWLEMEPLEDAGGENRDHGLFPESLRRDCGGRRGGTRVFVVGETRRGTAAAEDGDGLEGGGEGKIWRRHRHGENKRGLEDG